jgi:hypothetical protein
MCRSIAKSKQHNQILIQLIPGGEGSLSNVFQTDLNLIITQTDINLGKDLSTSKLIKKNFDAGQRIFVLDGDDIQRHNQHIALEINLSSSQIMLDNPKVKNSDGYTLCPIVPSIALSIPLIPWVSSCMAV